MCRCDFKCCFINLYDCDAKVKIMQKMIDKMNSVVRELLDGMLVIRAFNNEKLEEKSLIKPIQTSLPFLYSQHEQWLL